MRWILWWLVLLVLAGCAAYGGTGLKPGEASLDDVLRVMGQPAMRWTDPDGAQQLAYPRGPMGFHTYMAQIAPDGRLGKLENVLEEKSFARIRPGMGMDQVRRILGPEVAAWTVYFKARDELVWEWRYCDAWSEAARFNVLFDGSKETVRSTLSLTESQRGFCDDMSCICSH